MSVVVAIKDNKENKIWMGADAQMTYGDIKYTVHKTQNKIWKTKDNDQLLFGHVGAIRDCNLIQYEIEWLNNPPHTFNDFTKYVEENNNLNLKTVINIIVPKIINKLKDNGRVAINNNVYDMASSFLIAQKNKIFKIESNGAVIEFNDFTAIGSGEQLAYGAYEAIKDLNLDVKLKVIQCIRSACYKNIYINYPITLMNTVDNETIIIHNENEYKQFFKKNKS